MALGQLTNGISVREMAQAYCALVNDGTFTYSRTYSMVTDSRGNIVLDNVPQTIAASTRFIRISIGTNPSTDLVYALPEAAATTFEASKVYTFNITARMSGLNITGSTITDWTDGGTFTGDAIPGN
jgi:membrane carboxypeptidase/penicillin-binding protein